MAMQFDGKVAFITGAARGQGRSHAVRFAEEGADIIAIDLCDQIDSVAYPMATREDLDETVNLVEKTGRRIVAEQADVRDFERLKAVVAKVSPSSAARLRARQRGDHARPRRTAHEMSAYLDAVNVMLNGVYFTIEAALPALLEHGDGGAIVITSSAAGLNAGAEFSSQATGRRLCRCQTRRRRPDAVLRDTLAEKNIRVNSVHPGGVATPMIVNEEVAQFIAEHPEGKGRKPVPVPMVESADITEAMVYLCGQSGRYITGITLPVDAGSAAK